MSYSQSGAPGFQGQPCDFLDIVYEILMKEVTVDSRIYQLAVCVSHGVLPERKRERRKGAFATFTYV